MGITGLLPFLKGIQKDVHISSFKGMKVGVDAYCWLHKGVYSCSTQIVMKTAKIETLPFINYCLRRVNLLLQHEITPIMVFDGGRLPTKARTEKERRDKRQAYLLKGKELLKLGKKSEAHECFQKSVNISPEIALAFIKECRKLGVECIVAPYEADSQLAYLSKEAIVDVVITEDSDLLVFGSHRVLFKMDEFGYGKLIELNDLGKANKVLVGFTPTSFRHVCIFSGCDYLPSVHGVGLVKAAKLMRKHNQNPSQVIRALRCDSSNVPSDYEASFKKADETFLYQMIYDPRTRRQVRLHPLPTGVSPDDFNFAGTEHSPRKAVLMARGNINPITLEVLDQYSPSKNPPKPSALSTSWSGSAMGSANKNYPIGIQAKLPLTCSEKATRPFKPPSSVLTSRTSVAGTDVEEDEKEEEDIMGMYASTAEQEEKAGKEGLLSMYSSERDGGSEGESKNRSGESRNRPGASSGSAGQSRVMLSRFFVHESANHTTTSENCPDENRDDVSTERLSAPPPDSDIIRVAQPSGCNPKKRLFGNGRLNVFAFSKKRQRLDDSCDSGIGANYSWSSSESSSYNSSHNSQSQPRLSQNEPELNSSVAERLFPDDSGEAGSTLDARNAESRITSPSHSIPSSLSSSLLSHCQNSSVSLKPVSSCDVSENFQGIQDSSSAQSSSLALPSSAASAADPEVVIDLEEEVRKVKAPTGDIRKLKDSRRMTLPCTRSKRVGLSKKVKPPRLSDPGPTQMTLGAFAFSKKPQLKL